MSGLRGKVRVRGGGKGWAGSGGAGGCWQGVPREGRKVHATRAEWDARVRGRGVAGRSAGGRTWHLNAFGFGGGRVMSGLRILRFHLTTRQT